MTRTITTQEEYRAAMLQCYRVLGQVFALPLTELGQMQDRADTLGPFLDPTLWRDQSPKMREDQEVIRALLKAKSALPAEVTQVFEALGRVERAKQLAATMDAHEP